METPTSISFTDLELPVSTIFQKVRTGPMNRSWTRVQFNAPENWETTNSISNWLLANIPGQWSMYHYTNPKNKTELTFVIRFQDKNDALMFKLRGGHQAWQTS